MSSVTPSTLNDPSNCCNDLMSLSINDGENAEVIAAASSSSDKFFDSVIGHIEDILIGDSFQTLMKGFMEKYWRDFDDVEENKLCYMDIFKEYIDVIENYLETQLSMRIPSFSMEKFIRHMKERKTELDGEIFEMLYTFSDFSAFKEMFLDYKAMKEGAVDDICQNVLITSRCISGNSP